MAVIEKIVKNYEGNSIAGNELLTNIVLNRIFGKLVENDTVLANKIASVRSGAYRILPWVPGKTYNKNDLVWFIDCYLPPGKETAYQEEYDGYIAVSETGELSQHKLEELKDKYFTVTLYLLRCLKNGNNKQPVRTIVDMIPVFDATDWKNEYPSGSIYTDYFAEFTADNIMKRLNEAHQATSKHPLGELKSFSDIKEKVLLKDMSNIDSNRKKIFFPNESFAVQETKSILAGSCRKWDCGLLEYDLTFKLGDSEYEYGTYNIDGTVKVSEELDANYLNLAKSAFAVGSDMEYDNRKYYLNDSDSDIFKLEDEGITVSEGGIIQHRIDSRINSFYGKLDFQIPFKDTNYSIFPVNIPSVADATGQIVKNENVMVFVSKARKSVVAMLVIPNYNQSDYKVLGRNLFRCRITGRWK